MSVPVGHRLIIDDTTSAPKKSIPAFKTCLPLLLQYASLLPLSPSLRTIRPLPTGRIADDLALAALTKFPGDGVVDGVLGGVDGGVVGHFGRGEFICREFSKEYRG